MRRVLTLDYIPPNSKLVFLKKTTNKTFDNEGRILTYLRAIYKCECGIEKELDVGNVKAGKIVSCGCFKKEVSGNRATTHGLSGHPLFKIWVYIITRCENKNATAYKWYGGRGVKICKLWRQDFKQFYNWAIANGWEKGMTLDKDKIPKKLGIDAVIYSPDMCCFITHKENCNNRKSNHPITFNGITKNMTEWETDLGFTKDMIYNRLKNGWSEEKALSTPKLKQNKN